MLSSDNLGFVKVFDLRSKNAARGEEELSALAQFKVPGEANSELRVQFDGAGTGIVALVSSLERAGVQR